LQTWECVGDGVRSTYSTDPAHEGGTSCGILSPPFHSPQTPTVPTGPFLASRLVRVKRSFCLKYWIFGNRLKLEILAILNIFDIFKKLLFEFGMATTLDLTFVGVVIALLAVIAGWFMTQKEPEKVAAPPPKDVSKPEEKTVKPSKAGLPAKKNQIKVGSHPNMLCAFKGHTGEHSLLP